jgi:hypothetical protein
MFTICDRLKLSSTKFVFCSFESILDIMYVLFERIFHVWNCIFKLQQFQQNTFAIRAVRGFELGADILNLSRHILSSELGNLLEIVRIFRWASVSMGGRNG